VLSPALRTALEISLVASAVLRHITLFSFRGSKRILFYTQMVMRECETLHMARVINYGQRTKFKRESVVASNCLKSQDLSGRSRNHSP
jgi:hypothetical protein